MWLHLAPIIHHHWIMWAILMTCLDKPGHAQIHLDFRLQIWPWLKTGYAKAYRGFGGVAPKVTGFGE